MPPEHPETNSANAHSTTTGRQRAFVAPRLFLAPHELRERRERMPGHDPSGQAGNSWKDMRSRRVSGIFGPCPGAGHERSIGEVKSRKVTPDPGGPQVRDGDRRWAASSTSG